MTFAEWYSTANLSLNIDEAFMACWDAAQKPLTARLSAAERERREAKAENTQLHIAIVGSGASLDRYRAELTTLTAQLDAALARVAALSEQVSNMLTMAEVDARLEAIRDERNSLRSQLASLTAQHEALQQYSDGLFHLHEGMMIDLCKELRLDYTVTGRTEVTQAVASLTARCDELSGAAKKTLTYWQRNGLRNFQFEKMDDYMRMIEQALAAAPGAGGETK